jgi:hypothetical protein
MCCLSQEIGKVGNRFIPHGTRARITQVMRGTGSACQRHCSHVASGAGKL